MTDLFKIGFKADTSDLKKGSDELGKLGKAADTAALKVDKYGNELTEAQIKMGRFIDKAGRMREANGRFVTGLEKTSTQSKRFKGDMNDMSSAINTATKALAAYISVSSAWQGLALSDNYQLLNDRIRLATEATGDFNAVQKELFAISQETGTSLEGNVNLFDRIRIGAEELGRSNTDVLKLVTAIDQLGATGGTSVDALRNSTTQFSQALAGGVLRAEEFNSIVENTPKIAQAIAVGLDTTIGGLRAMVLEGEVLSEDIFESLLSQSESIADNFEKMPVRMGRATTEFSNSATKLLGSLDQVSGTSGAVAAAIGSISGAIDELTENEDELEDLVDTIQDTATFLAIAAGGYAAYTTAVGAATAATAAFNVVTKANPLGLMVTALGLGVAALYSFSDSADDASESMRILADETGRFNDKQIESANTTLLLEQAEIVKEITRLEEMRATQSGRTANATTIRIEKEKEKLAEIASLQASLLDREEARAESVALNMSAAYSRYQSARLSQIESESNALNSLSKQYQLYQMVRNDATADASAAEDFNRLALEYEAYQDARNSGEAANAVNLQSQYKLYQSLRSEAENIEQLPTPFDNWASAIDLAAESFAGLQSGVLGGTAEMEVAVDALNALQAVNAVINQSGGDPYSSFARMATMAASMASLGYSIGGLGGSFSDTSAEAQASQGTGTVLGSSDKQSESIANGIEDIESVNSSLLSVNYLMLSELQSLNSSIAGASAEIASNVSYDGVGNLGSFSSNPLEDLHSSVGLGSVYDVIDSLNLGVLSSIGSFFGGSSNVSDEGINIIGGTISDIVNSTTAAAFQQVQTKKYRWSSTKTNTYTSAVADSVENQFDSIYQGIVDTVAAGASAIGFSDNQISSVISSYVFDSINISLKDMSAEEQTAALEGVFSSAFDSLAAHMFPFLSEFQEAGEGFGETLTRIATELQVADKVAERFGQSLTSGTVGNIRLADTMAEVSGGADALASNLSGFTSSFYTEAEQAGFLFSDLTDIFSTLGMTVPDTAEGFRELVEAQNLNTIAGAENAATLLALQSSASEYYDLLEEADSVYDDLIDFVEDLLGLAADGTQTLASAQAAYIEGLELAATGDEDAISELSSLTQTYLDLFAAQASTGTEVLANRATVVSQLQAVTTQDNIPAFANGGSHTGGWRLVGERGPEMEYTGASTIYNNNDTSKMFDNSDVIAAVESLHKMMGFNLDAINTNTRKMTNLAQLWDNNGIPINSETPVNVAVV